MLNGLLHSLIFLLSFLTVLGALVFIHEMGHYSVARLFKVSVERFSVGFGKPFVRWKAKNGTEWVISRIPLGGYVKFLGDAGAASNPDTEHLEKIRKNMDSKHGKDVWQSCLHFKPLWQRALVSLAGPAANFILAIVIYAMIVMKFGTYSFPAKIEAVFPGGAAEQAGFYSGDELVSINGEKISSRRDVMRIVTLSTGNELAVSILRAGKPIELSVTPVRKVKTDHIGGKFKVGQIGIQFVEPDKPNHKSYNIVQASKFGTHAVVDSVVSTGKYIGRIFTGKENGKALGGIIKIAAITGKTGIDASKFEGTIGQKISRTFWSLLELAAALSVGLGFANLMPIPVLDGGHLLFYGYEAVMRKPLSEKAQEVGFRVGFAVLITLFLVLTWNDIGYVSGLFNKAG
ncbi:MAG: M50 family metallopeptidase [Robiginitomaculum sp.]